MKRVVTLRMPPQLLSKAEAKAARLGVARGAHLRGLVEDDLAGNGAEPKHQFASEDLLGSSTSATPGQSATNARVREVMRQRYLAKREKNR